MSTRIEASRLAPVTPSSPRAAANAPSASPKTAAADGFQTGHTHGARCGCGMPEINPAVESKIAERVRELAASAPSAAESAAESTGAERVIDVHFHVITKGEGAANGDVSQEQIDAQLQVLNEAYAGSGFQFRLASTDRTVDPTWYQAEMGTRAEAEMKKALRKGDSDDLNIYTNAPGPQTLGWATFPSDYQSNPVDDGVVLQHSSLPGGDGAPYNEGDTATHEVGHWMGLFHTWNETKGPGEPATGDMVDDTPVHLEPNYGRAPEDTDTAPDEPGFDPVRNFMNYVEDGWMNEFTDGQRARMQAQFELFRDTADEGAARVS